VGVVMAEAEDVMDIKALVFKQALLLF